MQLRSLSVRNVRSYEAGALRFEPGATLLVGDVGAGKTSLLYAIEMALFGAAEVDAAYLVRHGAAHAEVTVGFADEAHRYSISRRFRRLRRKGKEAFEAERFVFTVDGAETAYSATELRQRVIELLGFPDNPNPQAHSDLWRWAVYVPQERMREILAAKPQERLETVRKALGVERYRTAAENAGELATDLRRTAQTRRAEADRLRYFDEELATWSAEGDRLRDERTLRAEAVRERAAKAEAARTHLRAADAALGGIEAAGPERERLLRDDAADASALDERAVARRRCAEELARAAEERDAAGGAGTAPDAAATALEAAERDVGTRRGAVDGLAGALRSLAEARAGRQHTSRRRAECAEAEGRTARTLAEARTALETVAADGPTKEPTAPTPETVASLEAQIERARERESASAAEAVRARSRLDELDELLRAGRCPTCGQSVAASEFADHRAAAVGVAEAARAAHAAAVAERAGAEEALKSRERYERARDRWRDVEARRSTARAAVAAAEEAHRRAVALAAESAADDARAAAALAALAPREAEEATARAQLAAAERDREAARTALAAARAREDRAQAARERIAARTAELGRLDLELAAIAERRAARRPRIDALDATLAGADELRRARERADAAARSADQLLEAERTALARLDSRLDEATRRVATAEKGRAERATLRAEADRLERQAFWVGHAFHDALLRMEQRLLAHAKTAFERNFARYFATLLDDPSIEASTDLTFTPAVTIDGVWTPADALSGGERTSLALAFRLALAGVVRTLGGLRLSTLLLDEPTDGFSPEQVVRMGELLDELALPQVILVSHEGQLAAIADRVVRVEKKDGRSVLRPTEGAPGA